MKSREDVNEARKLIDIEIVALKSRRNTSAPISHLPDDLLLEIFRELQDIGFLMLHIVSHVCQHWRSVALEVTSLWTNPPTPYHDYTLLMLERSRISPLFVELYNSTREETSAAVLRHIARIESLIVYQGINRLGWLQDTLLQSQHEAAQLKTLKLSQPPRSPIKGFKLSASLFHKMPALQHLLVGYVDFEWQIFPIQNLTSLDLGCNRHSAPPSWTQFQHALNGMNCLEYLSISLPNLFRPESPSRFEHIKLPLLRKLEIHESNASVTRAFLSNSSFPRLRNADVTCSFARSSDVDVNLDYLATTSAVLSLIAKGNFGRLGNLTIGYDIFTMSTKSSSGSIGTDESTLDFMTSCLSRRETIRPLMTGLVALPGDLTSEIMHLCILDRLKDRSFTAEYFVELFGHLPRLESIEFMSALIDSREIIKALQVPASHPPGAPISFSRLRYLQVDGQYHSDEDNWEVLEELRKCLRQRHKHGAGLSNLVLKWHLTERELQYVQEILDDVRIRE